jgi:uncharacterized protein YjbI with pentapeptide repeats
MANPEHLALLLKSKNAWNEWRKNNPDTRSDLSGAKLTGKKLSGANLSGADLTKAKLIRANLTRAKLSGAYLSGADLFAANLSAANLTGAKLNGAYLFGANLTKARLIRANLGRANLTRANLGGARLGGAYLMETVFSSTNLRDVEGLDTCNHIGPSTVDHRTLAKSGPLPLTFLLGCGLPDKFIDYLPSLLNEPIQFYSCFISYSTKDQEFADRLYSDLQNKGVRCWFAPHDIQGGKKLHEQIDEAIRVYDRLLLILSEHSIRSAWVETEIAKARKREKRENRRMLFPIGLVDYETLRNWECFDADTGKDSAREIREFFIPDFSVWKDFDSYQDAFGRLLRDLKAESATPDATAKDA